jgi:hypothetical protein
MTIMTTSPSHVTATSRFAESYRAGTAVTAGSELSCGFTTQGRLVVFVADPAGSVRAVTQDPSADSGWTQSDVLATGLGGSVSLANAADGLHAVAFGQQAGPLLHTVLHIDPDGEPAQWPPFAPVPETNGWYEPCTAQDARGRFYAFFPSWDASRIGGIFQEGGTWNNAFQEDLNVKSARWIAPLVIVSPPLRGKEGPRADIQVFFTDAENASSWYRAGDASGSFPLPPVRDGVQQVIATGVSNAGVRHVLVAANDNHMYDYYGPSDGTDYAVSQGLPLITTLGGRAAIAPHGPDGVSVIYWDFDNRQVNAFGMTDTGTVAHPPAQLLSNVSGFFAGRDRQGTLEAFLVGNDGVAGNRLIYLREDEEQPTGWRVPVPIKAGIASIAGAYSPDGEPAIVAVTLDRRLLLVLRDEASGEWSSSEIDVDPIHADLPATEPFNCFVTEAVVRTPASSPVPGAAVTLTASTPVAARVQGSWRVLDPVEPLEVRSDPNGTVMIEMATDGIAVPTIFFELPSHPNQVMGWEPDTDVRATILNATASGPTLADTKLPGQETYLLPDEWRKNGDATAAIAKALHNCVSLGLQSETDNNTRAAVSGKRAQPTRKRLTPRPRATPPGTPRWHAAAGWRLSMRSGVPVVEDLPPLTRSQSATEHPPLPRLSREVIAAGARGRPIQVSAAVTGSSFLDVDWGDVWDAVTDGVANFVEYTVQPIVDEASRIVEEVQAAINVVIAGVEYMFQGVVSALEEVMSAAAGIFAQFGVGLQKLFKWLQFLFEWDDIWATAEAIDTSLQSAITQLDSLLGQGSAVTADWFAEQRQTLSDKITSAKKAVAGWDMAQATKDPFNDTLRSGRSRGLGESSGNPFDVTVPGAGAESSWLMSLVTNAGSALVSLPDMTIADTLEQKLTASFGQIDLGSVTEPLARYMEGFGDDTESFLTGAVSAILDAVAALLDAGLRLAGDAVQAAIAVARDLLMWLQRFLQSPVTIPLLADLYESSIRPAGNKDPLTLSRLFALILAVPVTIGYKFLYDVAPYPAKASTRDATTDLVGGGERLSPEVFTYFVAGVIYTPIDAVFDFLAWGRNIEGSPVPGKEWFICASIVIPLVMQSVSYPEKGQDIDKAVWFAKCAAPLFGCYYVIRHGKINWATQEFGGPRTDRWGIWGLAACAATVLVLNFARLIVQRSTAPLAWVAALVPPLGGVAKLLLLDPDPDAPVALVLIDIAADLGGASLYCYLHTVTEPMGPSKSGPVTTVASRPGSGGRSGR